MGRIAAKNFTIIDKLFSVLKVADFIGTLIAPGKRCDRDFERCEILFYAAKLIDLISLAQNSEERKPLVWDLVRLCVNYPDISRILLHIGFIENSIQQRKEGIIELFEILKIETDEIIPILIDLVASFRSIYCKSWMLEGITYLGFEDDRLVDMISFYLKESKFPDAHWKCCVAAGLNQLDSGNQLAVKIFKEILLESSTDKACYLSACKLARLVGEDKFDDEFLLDLYDSSIEEVSDNIYMALNRINQPSIMKKMVSRMRFFNQDQYRKINVKVYRHSFWTLWDCAKALAYQEFYEAWHASEPLPNSKNGSL